MRGDGNRGAIRDAAGVAELVGFVGEDFPRSRVSEMWIGRLPPIEAAWNFRAICFAAV